MIQIGNWVVLRCHPATLAYRDDLFIRVGNLKLKVYFTLGRLIVGKLARL